MTRFPSHSRLQAVRALSALTVALSLATTGCGGGSSPAPADAPADTPAPAPGVTPAPAAPTITAVSPATGFMSGGSTVTLTGTGLSGATAVAFGGTAATGITVVSDTQITVTVPAHSAGTVDVAVTTANGTGTAASAYSYSMSGQILTVAGGGAATGDGGAATAALLNSPIAAIEDAAGNLLVAEYQGNRVRVVAKTTGTHWGIAMTAGAIYTIAGTGTGGSSGDGGPATAATFSQVTGLAFDRDGNLAISDYMGQRVRLLAASTGTFYGIAMIAGNVYTIAGGGGSTADDIVGTTSSLNQPVGLASDADGNILVAGMGDQRVHVIAASTGTYHGRAMTAGNIYTLAGTGTASYSGDGGIATSATLNAPAAVLVDADGNVLVADRDNHRVRAIAAQNGTYYGVAMTAGNIYTIAGTGTSGTTGDGGSPLAAQVANPTGLAIDPAGNLAIASQTGRVRVIAASTQTRYAVAMTAGMIHSIAGGGSTLGDSGPATSARVATPYGLSVDGSGQLLVSELGSGRVRAITP